MQLRQRWSRFASFSLNQDVYRPGDRFTATARLIDAAGVTRVAFYSTVDNSQIDICGIEMHLVRSVEHDGIWRLSCTVPEKVRNGQYQVHRYAVDRLGNTTNEGNPKTR